MLTIDEVRDISFRKSNIGGYKPEDVNAFIDEIVETMEQNKKEKMELVKKLELLAKRIEDYRKEEESVRGALLSAQKIIADAEKNAAEKSEHILKDAEKKAQDIVFNASASITEEKNKYLKLQAEGVVLREQLTEICHKHLKMIEDLPTIEDLSAKKEDLDKRYPVKEIKKEEADEVVDITAQQQAQPPIKPMKRNEKNDDKKAKFSDLQFGENYTMKKK